MTVSTDLSSDDSDDDSESLSSEAEEESNGSNATTPESDRQRTLDAFYQAWKNEVDGVKSNSVKTPSDAKSQPESGTSSQCVLPLHDSNPYLAFSHTSSHWPAEESVSTDGDANHPDTTGKTEDDENVGILESGISLLSLGGTPPSRVAMPEWDTRGKRHISDLPVEVLLRVLRWAVGSYLDTRILGIISQVCRGFCFLANDTSIWRCICLRRWSVVVDTSLPSTSGHPLTAQNKFCGDQVIKPGTALSHYGSWRCMAIRRPQIYFDGCYLCRISYVRTGSPDFQLTYNPVHLVVYYRGIRFHVNGQVEMMTSSSPPEVIVAHLGKRGSNKAPANDTDETAGTALPSADGDSGCLLGTYEWCDPDMVVCRLHQPAKKDPHPTFRRRYRSTPFGSNLVSTFHICFRVSSTKRRLHNALHWESYVVHTTDRSSNTECSTNLDLAKDKFPTCYFSRVTSYTAQVAPNSL